MDQVQRKMHSVIVKRMEEQITEGDYHEKDVDQQLQKIQQLSYKLIFGGF